MKTCKNCEFYDKINEYCKYFCDFMKEESANICEYYEEEKEETFEEFCKHNIIIY